jgi:hypothetical protein
MKMSIIEHFDGGSGITYAYESVLYWDKEEQQPRFQLTLIGKIDKKTGEMLSTNGRRGSVWKNLPKQIQNPSRVGSLSADREHFYGVTYLLDQIGKKTEIYKDLN